MRTDRSVCSKSRDGRHHPGPHSDICLDCDRDMAGGVWLGLIGGALITMPLWLL